MEVPIIVSEMPGAIAETCLGMPSSIQEACAHAVENVEIAVENVERDERHPQVDQEVVDYFWLQEVEELFTVDRRAAERESCAVFRL